MVHHHKQECCVVILDCCLQGQGQNEDSNPQGIFVRMISSEPLNCMQPNLVWGCISMTLSAKNLGSYLQGQGHSARSNPQKIFHISWTSKPFATRYSGASSRVLECCVTKQFWIAILKVKVTVRVQVFQDCLSLKTLSVIGTLISSSSIFVRTVSSEPLKLVKVKLS